MKIIIRLPYIRKLPLFNIYFSFYHNIYFLFQVGVESVFFFLIAPYLQKKFQRN